MSLQWGKLAAGGFCVCFTSKSERFTMKKTTTATEEWHEYEGHEQDWISNEGHEWSAFMPFKGMNRILWSTRGIVEHDYGFTFVSALTTPPEILFEAFSETL